MPAAPLPTRAFVLGLAGEDGRLDATALYDVGQAAGFSSTQLRLALRRLGDAGLIEVSGRGRAAEVRLTDAGHEARDVDLLWIAAAHRTDAGLEPWDGEWHLLTFEIPEAHRAARDELRQALAELGFAALGGGIYASPYDYWPLLSSLVDRLGVAAQVTRAAVARLVVGGLSAPVDIARHLWDLDGLDDGYRTFVERWSDLDVRDLDEVAAAKLCFDASIELEPLLSADPVLPIETLPDGFAGPSARRLYLDLLDAMSRFELIERANLFGSHRRAIAAALTADRGTFWAEVMGRS